MGCLPVRENEGTWNKEAASAKNNSKFMVRPAVSGMKKGSVMAMAFQLIDSMHQAKKIFFKLKIQMLFIILICSLTACQSIFYHPDALEYSDLNIIPFANERFYIETPGQPRLYAWLLKTRQKQKRGIVIQFHGNAQNMTAHAAYLEWFLDQGFDVLTFDYRGYGKSEGHVDRAGILLDSQRVLDYAAEHFKGQKIILLGQSMGGAKVATALVRRGQQQDFAMLILDCTFYSYRSIARRKLDAIWLTWPLQYPLSWTISNADSPEEAFPQISIPTLVAHATKDPIVPFIEGETVYDSLNKDLNKMFSKVESPLHLASFAIPTSAAKAEFLKFFATL